MTINASSDRLQPVPVTLRRQGRLRFTRLQDPEIHCSLRRERLHAVYRKPWKIRHIQSTGIIAEAVALLGAVSLPPFYFNTADKPNSQSRPITVFANCSVDGYADVAAPDFVFEGWPEARFENFDAKAASLAGASACKPLYDRAFWTGRCDNAVRGRLVGLSLGQPDKIEAVDALTHYDPKTDLYTDRFKTMEEQVAEYRYMIDVEGFGYSGRLKLLLHAARALLLVDRPYREYFFDDIEPFRHYVPVKRDLTDLLDRIDWLRSNPKLEAEIVRETQQFARTRLTRKAAVEAWAKLLAKHVAAGGNLRSEGEHRPRPALI
jgi:hypothetical protein